MTKVLSLVKTAPSVTPDAFRKYWAQDYLMSLFEVPGVRERISRVVHNHVVPLAIREDPDFREGEWAGFSETWFDSREDAEAFLTNPAVAKAIASHAKVMPSVVHLHCTELPIWDTGLAQASVKMIAFFHPSASMTREQSQHYWTHEHVRIGSALNDPTRYAPRYVQNHMVSGYHTANPEFDYAGAPELWFSSKDAAQRMFREMSSESLEKLAEDEAKFSDRKKTISFITDEQSVYSRSASGERKR
jgi:hypothetical protein